MIQFIILLFSLNSWATITEQDKALFIQRNFLNAPGFESGIAGWTSSGGSFSATSTAANLASGYLTGSWDSNAAAQTLTSNSKSITSGDGLSAQTGLVSCRFKCASGTCTHTIAGYDGTSSLGSLTITSSTSTFVRTLTTFTMPTSGTIALRIASVASNEPQLFIDGCFLGTAESFNNLISSDSTINRIERLSLSGAACSSSPCTIAVKSAGINTVTRSGTGSYSINFVTGTFSAAPSCIVTGFTLGAANGWCGDSNGASTSAQAVGCRVSSTGATQDDAFSAICMGPK